MEYAHKQQAESDLTDHAVQQTQENPSSTNPQPVTMAWKDPVTEEAKSAG